MFLMYTAAAQLPTLMTTNQEAAKSFKTNKCFESPTAEEFASSCMAITSSAA